MIETSLTCAHCAQPTTPTEPVNGLRLCRACRAPALVVRDFTVEDYNAAQAGAAATSAATTFLQAHAIQPSQVVSSTIALAGTHYQDGDTEDRLVAYTFTLLLAVPLTVAQRIAQEGAGQS